MMFELDVPLLLKNNFSSPLMTLRRRSIGAG
jgi:hypothetical protein